MARRARLLRPLAPVLSPRMSSPVASLVAEPGRLPPAQAGCPFCAHLLANSSHALEWAVVAESRDFVAVPSVGALVPGWLLAIPKRHALNLAVLPRDEAAAFAAQLGALKARCTELFGPITTFE